MRVFEPMLSDTALSYLFDSYEVLAHAVSPVYLYLLQPVRRYEQLCWLILPFPTQFGRSF